MQGDEIENKRLSIRKHGTWGEIRSGKMGFFGIFGVKRVSKNVCIGGEKDSGGF